ncbi:uncharacterized protein N7473_000619 [Penicillium subrubescens]|uniref:Uncharacterized protein n=1 Tax=Penicillium subrubescens TaxID=1316194 RepID=A0A1Q5T0Z6_9EURO|nr:uncharacterized protein N7473_000619 [Penicillium subrubescens]KAJ5911316.1 hypothetical protein N7473_000619 [Penicillium subrubescens]OKO93951.1 hypothetical protein PENSUB_12230 [Penicillium subrubescens]
MRSNIRAKVAYAEEKAEQEAPNASKAHAKSSGSGNNQKGQGSLLRSCSDKKTVHRNGLSSLSLA